MEALSLSQAVANEVRISPGRGDTPLRLLLECDVPVFTYEGFKPNRALNAESKGRRRILGVDCVERFHGGGPEDLLLGGVRNGCQRKAHHDYPCSQPKNRCSFSFCSHRKPPASDDASVIPSEARKLALIFGFYLPEPVRDSSLRSE